MSALPSEADIAEAREYVRLGPQADISPAFAPIDQTRKGSKSCPSHSFNVMIGIIKAEHGRTTDAD